MVKNFLFNMGYDTSHVNSVIAKEGIESGSTVCLIVPKSPDERQENSISEIENYLDSLSLDLDLKVFNAGKDFQEDIGQFVRLFQELGNLVLSLSGGSRDILVPLTVSSVLDQSSVDKIYFRSDIDSDLSEVDLPAINLEFSDSDRKILSEIEDSSMDVSQICSKTGLSESTVYRKKSGLEDKGVLKTQKNEGREKLDLTALGSSLLK